jgi:hypothetical protein
MGIDYSTHSHKDKNIVRYGHPGRITLLIGLCCLWNLSVAAFYNPEQGRWVTRDPLGEVGGMNLYAFVGNNPVNWVDPFGLYESKGVGRFAPWRWYFDAGMTAFEEGKYVVGTDYMLDSLLYSALLVAPFATSPAVQGAVSSCSLGPAVAEAATLGPKGYKYEAWSCSRACR